MAGFLRIVVYEEGSILAIVHIPNVTSIQRSASIDGPSKTTDNGVKVISSMVPEPASITVVVEVASISLLSDTAREDYPTVNLGQQLDNNKGKIRDCIDLLTRKFLSIDSNDSAIGSIEQAFLRSHDTPVSAKGQGVTLSLVFSEFFVAEVGIVQGSLIRPAKRTHSSAKTVTDNTTGKLGDGDTGETNPDIPDNTDLISKGIQAYKAGSLGKIAKGVGRMAKRAASRVNR